jgi:hypothetical protein
MIITVDITYQKVFVTVVTEGNNGRPAVAGKEWKGKE